MHFLAWVVTGFFILQYLFLVGIGYIQYDHLLGWFVLGQLMGHAVGMSVTRYD